MLPALIVTKTALKCDPALSPGARGARKILVTQLYSSTEEEAGTLTWQSPAAGSKCPVQVMADTEVAVFNQFASQERHCHRSATEMYMVLEGKMTIEFSDGEYLLREGDMIIVNPGTTHEVKRQTEPFLCRVVTVNCGGQADKFEVSD